ncbi:MAG: FMN-binding protein [Tenericutes bacterium]|jgi:uncharacterized protein with FMN-binding domain|nr:FMN-binding protein [Mycoplasmatota bacterium]
MKKHVYLLVILTVIILIFIGGIIYFVNLSNAEFEKLNEIEILDVDLSLVEDGVYQGEYKSFPVEAIVLVTVENHVITDIEIVKHLTGQGADAEDIIFDVIFFQSIEVDMIAGATYSSKVILLAIRDALE